MSDARNGLGIIAGNRTLPLTLAREARAAGVQPLVAVGFEGETDPNLGQLVDEVTWVKVGQLVRMIDAFRSRGLRRCVMVGQIAPRHLFEVRPDWRALKLLFRLKERNARTIFGAIAEELAKDGIELISATPWLASVMPGRGYCVGPKLSQAQRDDLAFGERIAREVARLEIGQIVVVKRGTVLAVEAFEGTDACLRRGGELAGADGGAVAVKVASAQHDYRFDIPCLGPRTVEVCASAKIAVLAFESGKALLLEREATEALALQHAVRLITLD